MTRFLTDLQQSVAELAPLVDAIRKAASSEAAYTYTGLGPGIIPPAVGGVVILLVARVEDYLKNVVDAALLQYSTSRPPVTRSMLSDELSLRLARENLQASWQETVHGNKRSIATRRAHTERVVNRVAAGDIWGGDAIATSGNPGKETVKQLLKLLGLNSPWTELEREFATRWQAITAANPHYKAIPSAASELENLIGWRNIVAHTSGSLSIGPGELDEEIAFVGTLCESLDEVVRMHTDWTITQLGCTPAQWP